MKLAVLGLVTLVCASGAWAQAENSGPPTDAELAAVSARGRALAEYDAAAWHSSDAVEGLKPAEGAVKLYVAREEKDGWAVAYGRFNDDRTKFLIAYLAREGASPTEYKVETHEPPVEDADVYLREATAYDLVKTDFLSASHGDLRYNLSVLPTESGDWYVYAIPAQTEEDSFPYGADVRYRISADGTKILEKRQMHDAVMQGATDRPQIGFHTHVLSDIPEDSDVFYAMTEQAVHGEFIMTPNYVYNVSATGSIRYLGARADVASILQADLFKDVAEPEKAMIGEIANRVKASAPSAAPALLEVDAVVAGARCDGNALALQLSILLQNPSDKTLILHRDALRDAQGRFAATQADMDAGKYEKAAFTVPEATDFSKGNPFTRLNPGGILRETREYPVMAVNLKDKKVVQFLFFTWPPVDDPQADAERVRAASMGTLVTDPVLMDPAPLTVDPAILKSCDTMPKQEPPAPPSGGAQRE